MKVDLIEKFIAQSTEVDAECMFMNNWNKQFNFGVPVKKYADYINSRMERTHSSYPRGIQVMDFYNYTNVSKIYSSNF